MAYPEPNLTYFSPKVEKRESDIEGRGLFSKDGIKAGEVVVVKGGYVLTKAQRDEIGRELGPSEIQISEDLFIGPTTARQREGGMMHLNHSCEPNLGLQGQIVYVALRDIARDEELTFDYAMTDDEPIEMKCRCGKLSCRGVITGHDWQKPEIQAKYDGYFSWFIQRRIDAARKKGG
jgi:SET domain-containing protein